MNVVLNYYLKIALILPQVLLIPETECITVIILL